MLFYDLFKFVINLNDWIFEWNEMKLRKIKSRNSNLEKLYKKN